MPFTLRYYGDPVLRKRAQPIEEITQDIITLAEEMIDFTRSHHGWGLAAPQAGRSLRLFVMAGVHKLPDGHAEPTDDFQVYLNPTLGEPNKEVWTQREACFSIPGIHPEITRPVSITVEAMDLEGNMFKKTWEGMPARIVMHENDHLNGVLMMDRMSSSTERKLLEPRLKMIKKEYPVPKD